MRVEGRREGGREVRERGREKYGVRTMDGGKE